MQHLSSKAREKVFVWAAELHKQSIPGLPAGDLDSDSGDLAEGTHLETQAGYQVGPHEHCYVFKQQLPPKEPSIQLCIHYRGRTSTERTVAATSSWTSRTWSRAAWGRMTEPIGSILTHLMMIDINTKGLRVRLPGF